MLPKPRPNSRGIIGHFYSKATLAFSSPRQSDILIPISNPARIALDANSRENTLCFANRSQIFEWGSTQPSSTDISYHDIKSRQGVFWGIFIWGVLSFAYLAKIGAFLLLNILAGFPF